VGVEIGELKVEDEDEGEVEDEVEAIDDDFKEVERLIVEGVSKHLAEKTRERSSEQDEVNSPSREEDM